MKRTILPILVMLLTAWTTFAQNQDEAPQPPTVIPPSPDAAALGSFGEVPVGHFTGRPQIDIPFYTINLEGKEIPVRLSYQFMGLRPTQVVGTTGLGWVLDAGGSVSRTVKGRPDEKARFQYSDEIREYLTNEDFALGALFPHNLNTDNDGGDGSDGGDNPDPGDTSNGRTSGTTSQLEKLTAMKYFINDVMAGRVDTEPDVFNYSGPFGSGQLFFDWDAKPMMVPSNDLKLATPFDGIALSSFNDGSQAFFSNGQDFAFRAPDGMRYFFNEQELGRSDKSPDFAGNSYYQSAWHLSKISAPNGRDVTFNYFTSPNYELASKSVQHSAQVNLLSANCAPNCQEDSYQTSHIETYHQPHYLQEINFPDGKIVFYYSQQRQDLGTWQLDSLARFNLDGQRLSSYHLNYGYFGNNQYLKLLSVTKMGSDGVSALAYQFDYEELGSFPTWETTGLDHYGYFNGRQDNVKLYIYESPLGGAEFGGEDREPNSRYSSLGVLKSITYPTGGNTTFEFESNTHFIPDFIEKKQSATARTGSALGEVECDELIGTPLACNPEVSKTIVIPANSINIKVFAQIRLNAQAVTPSDPVDVQVFYEGSLVQTFTSSTSDWVTLNNGAGTYQIVSRATLNGTKSMATLSWEEEAPLKGTPVGGLRIKEISSFDGQGSLANKKVYEYKMEDGKPSGIAFGNKEPIYGVAYVVHNEMPTQSAITSSQLDEITATGVDSDTGEEVKITVYTISYDEAPVSWTQVQRYIKASLSGSSHGELGTSFGPSHGYQRVTEYQVDADGNTNGKQVYEFSHTADLPMPVGLEFPYQFRMGRGWKRGLLENHTVYQGNGNSIPYSKISEQANGYTFHDITNTRGDETFPTIFGLKFYRYYDLQVEGASLIDHQLFDYGVYEIATGWSYMKNSTTKSYGTTGEGEYVENSSSYTYDNVLHHMPTAQMLTNSKGEVLNTQFTYVHDLAQAGNVYETMLNQNQIATPVKTVVSKDGNFLSSKRTEFDAYQGNLLPKAVYTQKGTNSEELRVSYLDYDAFGNPLEFAKADDIHSAFVWDTDGLRPIAQAINAGKNQIWHTSFEESNSATADAWTGTKAQSNPQINASSLESGTYILSYWKKEGNNWNLYKEEFTISTTGYSRTISGLIDEVRIHPKAARMNTVAYDDFGRVISECDTNGRVAPLSI